jgi:hypothetical protein
MFWVGVWYRGGVAAVETAATQTKPAHPTNNVHVESRCGRSIYASGVGGFCLWVNCTGILVSINQPLRICVKAILSHERLLRRQRLRQRQRVGCKFIDNLSSNHHTRICRGWFMLVMYAQ